MSTWFALVDWARRWWHRNCQLIARAARELDPHLKLLWVALAAAVLAVHAARASAMIGSDRYEPSGNAIGVWQLAAAKDLVQSERLIEHAVRDLQQAAHQTDFASNEHVVALLRSAQDKLSRAAKPLLGERWLQVNRLLADVGDAIARGSARLGPMVSSGGESFGPPAFDHNELAQLIKEGQALVRHTAFRSPADTDDIA
jgi:hypothetical protein